MRPLLRVPRRTDAPADTAPADTAPADTAPADTAPAGAAPAGGAAPTGRTRLQAVTKAAILAGYLAAAVVVTWRLWADPAGVGPRLVVGGLSRDDYLSAWFMRYAATAVAHGQLPALVTKAINAPTGVNLMWNTSFLLPGVLLAPLTLAAGPQVSLTVVLTLGLAGSAASMYFVLRRWGASLAAAALGGAIYGFSPALRIATQGHYFLELAVLPPLIIDALLRIATGRGRAMFNGAWLGLLISAQLFIAEEVIAEVAVASLIMLVALAASRPTLVLSRLKGIGAGLGTAAVVLVVLGGHALWVQFHGPLTERGSPWQIAKYGNSPRAFVTAPNGLLFHSGNFSQFLLDTGQRLEEYFAYLGWPMLVLLLIAAVWFWRDERVRIAAITCAVLEVFSIGGNTISLAGWRLHGKWLPWHWLIHLPLIGQMLPNRFSILADGAAAAVLAFALDRAWAPSRRAARKAPAVTAAVPEPDPATAAGPGPVTVRAPRWRRYLAVAVLVVALVPLIPAPIGVHRLPAVPAGWQTALARLHIGPGDPVLIFPVNSAQTLDWQATTGGLPGTVIGGYCIARLPAGNAGPCGDIGDLPVLDRLIELYLGTQVSAPTRPEMKAALTTWAPKAIVAVTEDSSQFGRFMIRFFGRPTAQTAQVLAWRL
jgi:hypothetical protein